MASAHPEYSEFATCSKCGMKKYCEPVGRHYVCYSCRNGNFNGLRKINYDDTDRH